MSRDVRAIFVSRQASGNDVIRQIRDLWKMKPRLGADGIVRFDECIEAGDVPGVPYKALSELFSIGTDFDSQEPRLLVGEDLEVGRVGLRKNQEYRTWADKSLAGVFIVKEEDHHLIFQSELDDGQFGELNSWLGTRFGIDQRKKGSREAFGALMAEVRELTRVNDRLEREKQSLRSKVAEQKEEISSLSSELIEYRTQSFMNLLDEECREGSPPPPKRNRPESQAVASLTNTLSGGSRKPAKRPRDDESQEYFIGALEERNYDLEQEVERLKARVIELEDERKELKSGRK